MDYEHWWLNGSEACHRIIGKCIRGCPEVAEGRDDAKEEDEARWTQQKPCLRTCAGIKSCFAHLWGFLWESTHQCTVNRLRCHLGVWNVQKVLVQLCPSLQFQNGPYVWPWLNTCSSKCHWFAVFTRELFDLFPLSTFTFLLSSSLFCNSTLFLWNVWFTRGTNDLNVKS